MTELEKALNILSRKKLPPEPTWTSTPPTESGYYWCRLGKTKPFLVDWEYADGDSFAWDIEKEQEIPQVLLLEHEWWPIPLTPPED